MKTISFAAVLAASTCIVMPAMAQQISFTIPAGSLKSALDAYARQSRRPVVYRVDDVRGARSLGYRGSTSADQALSALLAKSGFVTEPGPAGSVAIVKAGNEQRRQVVETPPAVTDRSLSERQSADQGEIVVTATRMSESARRVPISLSAYDQKALDSRGIRSMEDAARITPGVTFSSSGFGAQSALSIRGVRSDVGAATVGVYVDDTPIQAAGLGFGNQNAYPKIFDLERVEILRGPQGTLFGSSSQGGTVRFITPAPGLQSWSSYARAEVSDTHRGAANYEVGGAIGGPLVEDKVGIRVSAYYRRDGGYIDRVDFPGGTLRKRNTNSADSQVVRGAITVAPLDDLKITAALLYQKTMQNDVSNLWHLLSDRENGRFKSGQRLPTTDRDTFVLPSLKIEYNGPGFDLISNTSYFSRNNNPSLDYSFTPTGIFSGSAYLPEFPNYRAVANLQNKYRSITQEVRAQSASDGRLRWVFGIYYNRLKQKAGEQIIDPQFGELIEYLFGGSIEDVTGMNLIDGKFSYIQDFNATTSEIAGFGDVIYELFPGVKLSVGARISRNEFKTENYVTGPFNFGTLRSGTSASETPFTPKFGVNWQVDPEHMIYATVAKGYRMGGGNIVFDNPACANDLALRGYSAVPKTYSSDSLWSYELGTKSRLFGSLQLAASVFQIDWSNIQQSIQLSNCGLQFVDNLGRAKSQGFDVELSQKIGSSLLLTAQIGYTKARYSKTLALSSDPGALPIVRAGNALHQQPWTINIAGQYNFDILDNRGYLRLDYNRLAGYRDTATQDRTTSSYDASKLGAQGYTMLNARLGANVRGLDLSVFANNILNEHPRLFSFSEGISEAGAIYRKEGTLRPRVIGLTAAYRY